MAARRAETRADFVEKSAKTARENAAACFRLEAAFAEQLRTHISFSVRRVDEKVMEFERRFQNVNNAISAVHEAALRAGLARDAGHWAAVVRENCRTTIENMK